MRYSFISDMSNSTDIVNPKRIHQVLVIGAGVAGISAAQQLVAHGIIDVVILEARHRIGGRIHTVEHDGAPLELGAEWIQGACPANSMFNLANSNGGLGKTVQRLNDRLGNDQFQWPNISGYIFKSNGEPLGDEATKHVHQIFSSIREEAKLFYRREFKTIRANRVMKEKTRLLSFYNSRMRKAMENIRKELHKSVADDIEHALSGLRNAQALMVGDDIEHCRLELVGSKRELPGGYVIVPDGVVGILESIVRSDLPNDCLKLGRRVTMIDWSLVSRDSRISDKILVECITTDGHIEEYNADFVICTLPLGVLKRYHQQMFYPGLEASKAHSLHALGFGNVAKIFLEWSRTWWARGEGGITLAWSNEEIKTRSLPRDWHYYIHHFAEVNDQPKLLVCWVAGSGSKVVDQVNDEEIAMKVTWILQTFTGDPGIPLPRKVIRDTWSADPFALGSWTVPLMQTEESDILNLESPLPNETEPRLLFAGEATSSNFFATMHGARLSGLREAQRIREKLDSLERMSTELDKVSDHSLRTTEGAQKKAPISKKKP